MNQRFATPSFTLRPTGQDDDYFSSIGHELGKQLTRLVDWVLDHMESSRDRAALARMDDAALKDIGMTRSDIERVAQSRHPRA